MWGKLCKMFVITISLSYYTGVFLSQLIQFFSERSRSLYTVARPSVCLSVVGKFRALYCRLKFSTMFFGTLTIRWHPRKILRRLSRELNARGLAKYNDFGPIERYISETVKTVTNRKPYMTFRLVPKSVTLNDLEQRNGPYFATFHRIHVRCHRKKFTFAISSPDEFLVFEWRDKSLQLNFTQYTVLPDNTEIVLWP